MKLKNIKLLAIVLFMSVALIGCEQKQAQNQQEPEQKTEQNQDNKNAEEAEPTKAKTTEATDADKAEAEKVSNDKNVDATIYTINSDQSGVEEKSVKVKAQTAYSIYGALKEAGVVPKNSKIISFDTKDINGVKTGLVNVDSKFMNPNLGTDEEFLMLEAFTKSINKNLGTAQIELRVDGKMYESGHISLQEGDYLKY